MQRVRVRDREWRIQSSVQGDDGRYFLSLLAPVGGETLNVLSPPEKVEYLPDPVPILSRASHSPWVPWFLDHLALKYSPADRDTDLEGIFSGRISPEAYQFAPAIKLLSLPDPRILIADDVGLGKTIEAGICIQELIARGRGGRILLVVPPGLIPQWQVEMFEKFGLNFHPLEDATGLDRTQTMLAEGIKPWAFLPRVITSIEYLKKREVFANALEVPWDLIVVDEAHYLAESGTPTNPYLTARARLGRRLRDASRSLILLTATPHNGYRHSFRSILEIVEPTDATFMGDEGTVRRRISRSMIRRLKPQIYRTDESGNRFPAFQPREPVVPIRVEDLNPIEKDIFKTVSSYCARTAKEAEGTDSSELVGFAMQIIKKRMLSSRASLSVTVSNRLQALRSRQPVEEPPPRTEVRELQGDMPFADSTLDRIHARIVRSSLPKEARQRNAEKRRLQEISKLLDQIEGEADPKIVALLQDLKATVLPIPGEKAIIFTEYLDTLNSIKTALDADPEFRGKYVELTGGIRSQRKRTERIAAFSGPQIRILLATDAASEGLNLHHHCRRLYHFELPWNPNRMEQRNGRIDRHGQKRSPIIRYLFYPDSPEDRVLDRLVTRIVQMQEDRVSTPDIIGIISAARIEEAITGLDACEREVAGEESLFHVIEERMEDFQREIAPLLTAMAPDGAESTSSQFCADPMVEDDLDFERFIQDRLAGSLSPGALEHTWRIDTPPTLRGADVREWYESVTFRRSVAIQHRPDEVEYVTRLHPLFRAISDEAYNRLSAAGGIASNPRRLAARRHPDADRPCVVFTFALTDKGRVLGTIAVTLSKEGAALPTGTSDKFLSGELTPGEVRWEEIETEFGPCFERLQETAVREAWRVVESGYQLRLKRRKEIGRALREDAGQYRVDRLAEIDREEREARFATDRTRQGLLFEERDATGFRARRAAVETHYVRRLEQITAFEAPQPPEAPQPLGALFVFRASQ